MKSARTYTLYERFNGRLSSQWQYKGTPTVPGCYEDYYGDLYPPAEPAFVVRAKNVKQAHALAYNSRTTSKHPEGLGIAWESGSESPQPLAADLTRHPVSLAWCRVPTAIQYETEEEAREAKKLIDRFGCGGGCRRDHEIIWLTQEEAIRRRFYWLLTPEGCWDFGRKTSP